MLQIELQTLSLIKIKPYTLQVETKILQFHLLSVFQYTSCKQLQSDYQILHFVRHAHSKFNKFCQECEKKHGANYLDTQEYLTQKFCHKYLDVQITEEGVKQAEKAREMVKDLEADIVLVSPMRRALRTCHIMFQNHPSNPAVIVQPAFRQIMQSSNDIGSKIEESMQLFPSFNFDKITDKQAWFVSTLSQQKDRMDILGKLNNLSGKERRDVAIQECLKMMKQNWFKMRKEKHNQEALKQRTLPDYKQQKKVLDFYAKKYKNIVVLSHAECLKRFSGYKLANCQVFSTQYKK